MKKQKRRFADANETDLVQSQIGTTGDMMSFEEIGKVLGISEAEAARTFKRAMAKLKSPKIARALWEYSNVGETPDQYENGGEKV